MTIFPKEIFCSHLCGLCVEVAANADAAEDADVVENALDAATNDAKAHAATNDVLIYVIGKSCKRI